MRDLCPGPCPYILRNDLARVKLHQHGRVRLEVFHGHSEAKVVEDEKLDLEVVELGKGKSSDLLRRIRSAHQCMGKKESAGEHAYLGVSRIGVKDVGEELARAGDAGDD